MKPNHLPGRLLDTVAPGRHAPTPMTWTLHAGPSPVRHPRAPHAPSPGAAAGQQSALGYAIDLNDRADDSFKVTAWVGGLTDANAIYQFAATAPGTYQVMDIGRYVRRFEAFDAAGQAGAGRAGVGQPVEAERSRAGAHPPLRHLGDLGHPGGPAPGLPHVRDLDRAGSRAHQPPCGHRLPQRDAGEADPAADRVSRRVESGHRAGARPVGRVPRGGLRSAGGLAHPPRPTHRGTNPGHRRAGGDLHLFPTPGRSAPRSSSARWTTCSRPRGASSASCRWTGTPSSTTSTSAPPAPGSIPSAPSTCSRRASSPIRWAAT